MKPYSSFRFAPSPNAVAQADVRTGQTFATRRSPHLSVTATGTAPKGSLAGNNFAFMAPAARPFMHIAFPFQAGLPLPCRKPFESNWFKNFYRGSLRRTA